MSKDNVVPFDMLSSQLQVVVDRMGADGIVGAIIKDDAITSGFSGELTISEAAEMVCRLIQFIFEDMSDEE